MARKQHSNPILDNPDNEGIHSTRRLKSVHTMMTTHGLSNAVVYQFILSGSTRKEYQATIKALARHIRTKCRAEYIGAHEIGDEKGGEHAHAYFIIETLEHFPGDLLDVSAGKFIARRIKRKAKAKVNESDKSLSIRIAPPRAPIHRGAMFAKMDTAAKLADCIEWVEYHVKGRSKAAVQDREIYFASEFASNAGKREARRQKYRDALTKSSRPAVTAPFPLVGSRLEGQITLTEEIKNEASTTEGDGPANQGNTGTSSESGTSGPTAEAIRPERTHGGAAGPADQAPNSLNGLIAQETAMTPAERYIASRYEEAVDLQLDVGAVRRYLLAHGIKHTPAQVVHQLDNVLCFTGYAASHPAPLVDVEAYDRTTARKDWINPIPFPSLQRSCRM